MTCAASKTPLPKLPNMWSNFTPPIMPRELPCQPGVAL